jgi:hypothetical protein
MNVETRNFRYEGIRYSPGQCEIEVVEAFGPNVESRTPIEHVVWHSPTGYEWGYGGSGPADAALSILSDYFHKRGLERVTQDDIHAPTGTEPHIAIKLHQPFKRDILAGFHGDGFTLRSQRIDDWLEGKGSAARPQADADLDLAGDANDDE